MNATTPGTLTIEEQEDALKTSPESAPPTPPPDKPVTTAAPASGDFVYFEKILASMPFFINRVAVQFEPLASNRGVLRLEAADPLVEVLKATAIAKRGGIVLIDEDRWLDLKKKLPFNPLAIKSKKHVLQIAPSQVPRKKSVPVESVAGDRMISGEATGVGLVGGSGAGVGAGTQTSVPASPPPPTVDFAPAVAKKSFKMPVLKKTGSRSFEGGIPEPEPND